ncbi:MAG: hypothetical protein RTU30_03970 [Candidatus Thorarchaeota archaeon]
MDTSKDERNRWMSSILSELVENYPGSLSHALDELHDPHINPNRKISTQLVIIKALGFQDHGLLDFEFLERDFAEILTTILSITEEPQEFRDLFATELTDMLLNQINRKGTTIEVDVVSSRPEIIRLVPRILDLRKHEIESVCLPISEQGVNLRPLWLTAYGLQSLQALQVKVLFVDLRNPTFCDIDTVFSDLGYPLQTGDEDRVPVTKMSDSMQNFILTELAMSPVSHEDRIHSLLQLNPDLSLKAIARLAKVPFGQVRRAWKKLKQ